MGHDGTSFVSASIATQVQTSPQAKYWHDFHEKLDRLFPRYVGPTQLVFEYGEDDWEGI